MTIRLLRLVPLAILIVPQMLLAARDSVEAEYQQVRKIAIRDAKVKAAFDTAEQRLDAKVVEIDPALMAYVEAKKHAKPASAAVRKPAAKPTVAAVHGVSHVVAAGETLGSIAAKYGVRVAALKTANHIADDRKLRAGQTLRVPGAKPPRAPKREPTLWERVKRAV